MKSALYELLLSIQGKTFAPSASYYSHDLVEETIKGNISYGTGLAAPSRHATLVACSVKAVLKSIIKSECEENTAYTGNGFISLRTSVWWAKTALLQRNLAEYNKSSRKQNGSR
jgi:hypothetical protein